MGPDCGPIELEIPGDELKLLEEKRRGLKLTWQLYGWGKRLLNCSGKNSLTDQLDMKGEKEAERKQ